MIWTVRMFASYKEPTRSSSRQRRLKKLIDMFGASKDVINEGSGRLITKADLIMHACMIQFLGHGLQWAIATTGSVFWNKS